MPNWMKRRWIVLMLISLVCAVIFAGAMLNGVPFLGRMEGAYSNFRAVYGRLNPPHQDIVFMAIDRQTYREMFWEGDFKEMSPEDRRAAEIISSDFPWNRDIWALTLEKLMQAGAKAVAFDFLFVTPTDNDLLFRNALAKYRDNAVVASNFPIPTDRGTQLTIPLYPSSSIVGLNPDGETAEATAYWTDRRVGYVNYTPDPVDDTVRRTTFYCRPADQVGDNILSQMSQPLTGLEAPGTVYPSLVTQICKAIGRNDAIPHDATMHLFRYAGPPTITFACRPIYGLFVPKIWKETYDNGAFFKDKIVIFGPYGNWSQDFHNTPFGQMSGPEVHLNVLSATLDGAFLEETRNWTNFLLIFAGALLAWPIALWASNYWARLTIFLLATGLFLFISQLLHDHANLMVLTTIPLLAFNASGIIGLVYDNVLERIERARVRHTLERYVSKNVVREILENPQGYYNTLGGVRAPVTILFSDVRNFTTMTENADPAQLVAQINEYMKEMVHLVFLYQGTLDKFIGDAVMAVWGNIRSEGPDVDCRMAVRTALHMLASLEILNPRFIEKGWPPLHIGIGVNHGDAIVGNIGSDQKMEPTVLGDPVNLASRLESLTKKYGLNLLLGPQVADKVRDHFVLQPVDFVTVKGKTKPVEIFTCRYTVQEKQPEAYRLYLEVYLEATRLFRGRKFAEAELKFKESLSHLPEDKLAKLCAEQSSKFAANPPDESWDGSTVMTEK